MGFEVGEPHNVQLQSIRWVRKRKDEEVIETYNVLTIIQCNDDAHEGKGHIIACTAPSSTAL